MFGNSEFWENWWRSFAGIIEPAIWSTLRMLFFSMLFAIIIGFVIGIVMVITGPAGLRPRKKIYGILDFFVNIIRSFPIIILIVAISPITRIIVGTTIGEKAAILPLTIAAAPFVARIIETSLLAVDRQLVEAARSFGMSDIQIVFRVLIRESFPAIIAGITLSAITFLSATTLAGAVGAGGLGAVALNYGYQSFNDSVLYTSVFILLIMVQIIQMVGNRLYKRSIRGGK